MYLMLQGMLGPVLQCADPLYFSVPRGLTYPDSTVFQCPQRSDLSGLHCISVSPEV